MMADGNDGESVRDLGAWRSARRPEPQRRHARRRRADRAGKLTDFCPLYIADGDDATPVSQFDKDDVEKWAW